MNEIEAYIASFFLSSRQIKTKRGIVMRKLIDKYNEELANNEKFNRGVVYGAIILQGICTVAIVTASYFAGMRKGVDITDAYYDRNGKEI